MATLVNKMNREVKVIIPNMREFRTFYSDNEGVIGMFFKRDWEEEPTKQEEHWKPSEEQIRALKYFVNRHQGLANQLTTKWDNFEGLKSLYNDCKKLM